MNKLSIIAAVATVVTFSSMSALASTNYMMSPENQKNMNHGMKNSSMKNSDMMDEKGRKSSSECMEPQQSALCSMYHYMFNGTRETKPLINRNWTTNR